LSVCHKHPRYTAHLSSDEMTIALFCFFRPCTVKELAELTGRQNVAIRTAINRLKHKGMITYSLE